MHGSQNLWRLSAQKALLKDSDNLLKRYGLALVCAAGALLVRMALEPILLDHQPFPTFFLAIILVNWWCGLGPSLLTIGLGVVFGDIFIRHQLLPATPQQWIGLATYLVVSLVLVWYGWANRRTQDRCAAEIGQRRQAEEVAHQSERRLAMVAAATFEGVAISENTHFIEVNDQLATMLGYTREEMLGKPLADVIAIQDRQTVLEVVQGCIEVRMETTMVRKDGSQFIAEAHGKTAEFGNRRVRFTALRDITRRKHAEDALRQAQEELANYNLELERTVKERTANLQQTVAELHRFSYALAHDMRAPLRATSGFITLIEKESNNWLTPASREWFRRVKVATKHLDQMITDALNYTKAVLRDLVLESVDLQALVAGLLETYPNLHADSADIKIGSPLPTVLGNRAALIQCLSNLLDNAVKFSHPGIKPKILIWAEERPGPGIASQTAEKAALSSARPHLEPGACQRDPLARFVRIWVEDNGIGISKGSEPRLFTMFERLNTDHEGTGIGLAIVRKVVQRMGGECGVESEEGQGSRFWFEVRRA